jgi:L-methionine (R)-S-oxide reductase
METKIENKSALFESVVSETEKIIGRAGGRDKALLAVCQLLAEKIPHYNWVGFYLVDAQNERELVLGPYVGDPTDHTRIAFGQGICGQAADREETFVIQDVSRESNYLSCSINVKSEIVVPIFKEGRVIGELDIDSHKLSPFNDDDRRYLEKICEMISGLF